MEIKEAFLSNPLTSSNFINLETSGEALSIGDLSPLEEQLKNDLWSFGFFWREIVEKFSTVDRLYAAIQDLRQIIQSAKEKFGPTPIAFSGFQIEPNSDRGVSGSYFLIDESGTKRFLIKPLDEDAGCIHSNGFASPFTMSPLRANMPLYLSSMREVLASLVAESIGVGSIVPKTTLGIFESDQFHDFSKGIHVDELQRYLDVCGPADKEKLCSVQEFVPNAKTLFEGIHELEMAGLSDDEIADRFDQKDFEDANILMWTTYDTDGHMGNFLVYPKGVDQIGNEILGLKKIDNGLAFPEKNQQFRNNLSYLPNAKRELSEEGRAKIEAIDINALSLQFEKMGLEGSTFALKERMVALKELASKPGVTIKEINTEMSQLGKKQ